MVGAKSMDVMRSVKSVSNGEEDVRETGVKEILQVTKKVTEVTVGVNKVKEAIEMFGGSEEEGGGRQEDLLGAHGGGLARGVRGNMILT